MSSLSAMLVPATAPRTKKRHAGDVSINDRFTKVAKICDLRPLAISISDFPRRMTKKASQSLSRQDAVHGILMAQRMVPSDFLQPIPAATLDSLSAAPSPLLAAVQSTIQQAPNSINPAADSATADDAPAVRRSTRLRKDVYYYDGLRSRPVQDTNALPSMADKEVSTEAPKISKETVIENRDEVSKQPSKVKPILLPKNTSKAGIKPRPGYVESSRRFLQFLTVEFEDDKSTELAAEDEETTSTGPQAPSSPMAASLMTARTDRSVLDGELFQTTVDSFQNTVLGKTHKPLGTSPRTQRPMSNTDTSDDHTANIPHSEKVQSNPPSGRTLAELEAWLKPPARPKKSPLDLTSPHAMKLSYSQIGSKPKSGMADMLVREMEERHALEVQGWTDGDD